VDAQQPSGPRLVAFFGVMYYCGLRPEEAVMLRTADLRLPADDGWGEMHVTTTAPDAGTRWTDTGAARDRRGLKHRGEGEIRTVPIPPPQARLFRAHVDQYGASPEGHMFRGVKGGPLATVTYRRAWDRARKAAFDAAEYTSPLARRPYDLRHACLSTWLNGGVAPAQVAEWAGHSVEVLLRTYVRCLEGQHDIAKRRIMEALDDPARDDGQSGANEADGDTQDDEDSAAHRDQQEGGNGDGNDQR
jgi:integrase